MFMQVMVSLICCFLPFIGWSNEFKEVRVETEGVTLFCKVIGQGDPVIVLHGGPGLTHEYLLPFMTKLAETNFVIFYDQRGCGQSTGNNLPQSITLDYYVKDVDAIRKFFHYDKISLLGHSWGGMIAANYAVTYPESMDKLILSNSVPITNVGYELFVDEFACRSINIQQEMKTIEENPKFTEGDPQLFANYCRLIFERYCYIPVNADKINLKFTRENILHYFQISTIFREQLFKTSYDFTPSLNKLSVPTLIIHGDYDPVPVSTAKYTSLNICGSKFIILEDCGHFPFVEKPTEYFQAINKFLHP